MTITLRFMNKLDRYGRNTIRYDISHTDFQGVKLRKAISTGIKVLSKDQKIDRTSALVRAVAVVVVEVK